MLIATFSYSWRMRFAVLNSGIGLLAAASELHRLRPDADLVIAMDPDGMPWGPRTPDDIAERSVATAMASSVAIWATVATTASDYQRWLIAEFGGQAQVTPVACPGLATAVDAGD